MSKLTLPEWLAKTENTSIEWAKEFLIKGLTYQSIHAGDCTKQPYTCNLCMLENILKEYREYYFEKENVE